jgi:hypothetical protein
VSGGGVAFWKVNVLGPMTSCSWGRLPMFTCGLCSLEHLTLYHYIVEIISNTPASVIRLVWLA